MCSSHHKIDWLDEVYSPGFLHKITDYWLLITDYWLLITLVISWHINAQHFLFSMLFTYIRKSQLGMSVAAGVS